MMHPTTVTLAILMVLALVHFSYVDFRFRHRGSVLWFWLARPAPLLLWLSRAAIAAAFATALLYKLIGPGEALTIILVTLVLAHVVTLILVERHEDEWPPPPPPA